MHTNLWKLGRSCAVVFLQVRMKNALAQMIAMKITQFRSNKTNFHYRKSSRHKVLEETPCYYIFRKTRDQTRNYFHLKPRFSTIKTRPWPYGRLRCVLWSIHRSCMDGVLWSCRVTRNWNRWKKGLHLAVWFHWSAQFHHKFRSLWVLCGG